MNLYLSLNSALHFSFQRNSGETGKLAVLAGRCRPCVPATKLCALPNTIASMRKWRQAVGGGGNIPVLSIVPHTIIVEQRLHRLCRYFLLVVQLYPGGQWHAIGS